VAVWTAQFYYPLLSLRARTCRAHDILRRH
jgi:hypothetical protein